MKKEIFFVFLMFGMFQSFNAQIPTDGLVSFYPFNNNANDESGNGNNGIVHDAILTSDRFGNMNSAYSFNGVSSYIDIPYNSSFILQQDASLCAWVNSESDSAGIIFINLIEPDGWGVQISWPDSNKPAMSIHIVPTSYTCTADNSLTKAQWYFITGVRNGASLRLYVNGALNKEISVPTSNSRSTTNSVSRIGKAQNNNADLFKGSIDDIRIYNRALNESEILSLYNACSVTKIIDTVNNFVSNTEFELLSPKIYLETIDTLPKEIGDCDSIIYHYLKYVFEPNNYSDTIWVNDTVLTEVFDTTFVTIYDSIEVTDTLLIDVTISGINPPDNLNTLKVYPNPTKDIIYINTGTRYNQLTDYKIKIINTTGGVIFESNLTEQLFEIQINEFGQTGLFLIQIIDNSNHIIDIRKILLE